VKGSALGGVTSSPSWLQEAEAFALYHKALDLQKHDRFEESAKAYHELLEARLLREVRHWAGVCFVCLRQSLNFEVQASPRLRVLLGLGYRHVTPYPVPFSVHVSVLHMWTYVCMFGWL
jgi:hypothetical protein